MENTQQENLFGEVVRESSGIRCSICGKGLTNPVSVRVGIGPDCRHKYKIKAASGVDKLIPLPSITRDLIDKINFWCSALKSQISDKDSVIVVDRLIDKAETNIYMSAVVVAAEIDAVVEVYDRQGVRRDDILMGLKDIQKATGKRIGGFL